MYKMSLTVKTAVKMVTVINYKYYFFLVLNR